MRQETLHHKLWTNEDWMNIRTTHVVTIFRQWHLELQMSMALSQDRSNWCEISSFYSCNIPKDTKSPLQRAPQQLTSNNMLSAILALMPRTQCKLQPRSTSPACPSYRHHRRLNDTASPRALRSEAAPLTYLSSGGGCGGGGTEPGGCVSECCDSGSLSSCTPLLLHRDTEAASACKSQYVAHGRQFSPRAKPYIAKRSELSATQRYSEAPTSYPALLCCRLHRNGNSTSLQYTYVKHPTVSRAEGKWYLAYWHWSR